MLTNRRRRKREGVALMEGLIVAAMTTAFFGATWFFYDLNQRKGATLRQARYQAWAATRFECEGSSVRGQNADQVQVPHTMRMGTLAAGTMPVTSQTEMACNVKPHPEDTVLSAFASFTDLISW